MPGQGCPEDSGGGDVHCDKRGDGACCGIVLHGGLLCLDKEKARRANLADYEYAGADETA